MTTRRERGGAVPITWTSPRARLSASLFARVAGADGPANRHRIHHAPGPRWFEPGSAIQRVHGDASMYVGGVRALLLQSLHPLAMAAVNDYSRFREDVWGRLARTATFLAETTFAAEPDAERAVAIVRAVHRHITGTAPDGRHYRADDPHLLLWVHVAEVDSFLTAHQRFGAEPLDAAGCDEYVAQAATIAVRLGVEASEAPTSTRALHEVLAAFGPELAQTGAALDVATFLLRRPPIPAAAMPAYRLLGRSAVATLPRWSRPMLGLPDTPRLDVSLWRVCGLAATGAMRWLAYDTGDQAQQDGGRRPDARASLATRSPQREPVEQRRGRHGYPQVSVVAPDLSGSGVQHAEDGVLGAGDVRQPGARAVD